MTENKNICMVIVEHHLSPIILFRCFIPLCPFVCSPNREQFRVLFASRCVALYKATESASQRAVTKCANISAIQLACLEEDDGENEERKQAAGKR